MSNTLVIITKSQTTDHFFRAAAHLIAPEHLPVVRFFAYMDSEDLFQFPDAQCQEIAAILLRRDRAGEILSDILVTQYAQLQRRRLQNLAQQGQKESLDRALFVIHQHPNPNPERPLTAFLLWSIAYTYRHIEALANSKTVAADLVAALLGGVPATDISNQVLATISPSERIQKQRLMIINFDYGIALEQALHRLLPNFAPETYQLLYHGTTLLEQLNSEFPPQERALTTGLRAHSCLSMQLPEARSRNRELFTNPPVVIKPLGSIHWLLSPTSPEQVQVVTDNQGFPAYPPVFRESAMANKFPALLSPFQKKLPPHTIFKNMHSFLSAAFDQADQIITFDWNRLPQRGQVPGLDPIAYDRLLRFTLERRKTPLKNFFALGDSSQLSALARNLGSVAQNAS